MADGLVTKGDCVINPKTLRRDILEKLHVAHQGIEKTRLRARTCVYWSGIKGDIEEMINTCSICQPRSYNVVQPSGGVLKRNRRHIRSTGEHHQVGNGSDDDPNEGSVETRRDVPDDNPNAERDVTPPAKSERHVTFAPDSTYLTRSGRSVKPPRRLEL